MKTESILQLVARLFSIYLLAAFVFPVFEVFFHPGESALIKARLTSALLTAILAAFFWFFPQALAHKILPKEKDIKTRSGITLEELQALCFAILGMWVCIHAIAPVLRMESMVIWD